MSLSTFTGLKISLPSRNGSTGSRPQAIIHHRNTSLVLSVNGGRDDGASDLATLAADGQPKASQG